MQTQIESIFFTKDNFTGNKKSFRMTNGGKKLNYVSPYVYIPFGVETYNGKQILNIEVNTDKNNNLYNFLSSISQIDNMLQNLQKDITDDQNEHYNENNIHNENKIQIENKKYIKDLVKGKQFVSCIRNGKNGHLIRTYIKQGINIHSPDSKEFFKLSELKGRIAVIDIDLGNLWIMPDSYGYVLNVTDIMTL